MATAVVLCAVGAALVLVAAGQPWVRAVVELPPPLPSARQVLSGGDLVPPAAALGLAGLAGLAGVVATRRVARVAVGGLLALMGAGAAVLSVVGIRPAYALGRLSTQVSLRGGDSAATLTATPWWAVSLVGGVLLLAAGLLTVARGGGWPGMSGRYDRPGVAQATTAEQQHEPTAMWDSLDRGGDPTVTVDDERATGKGI